MPKSINGFVTKFDRDLHFDSHASEFSPPFASEEEYEAAAIAFLEKHLAAGMMEGLRIRDGATIRYDPGINEFAICDDSGAVTTYFKPDPAIHKQGDNVAYFRSRLER